MTEPWSARFQVFVTHKMGKKAVAKEPKKAPANKAVAKVQKTPKETVTGKKEPLKKKQKKERKTEKRETLQDKWNMSGGYELKVKCDPKAIIAALITDKVKGVAETDVTNWLGTTFLHFKSPEAAKKACQQCAEINVWCDSKVKVKQGREPTVAVARPQNGMVTSPPSLCFIVLHVSVSFVFFLNQFVLGAQPVSGEFTQDGSSREEPETLGGGIIRKMDMLLLLLAPD